MTDEHLKEDWKVSHKELFKLNNLVYEKCGYKLKQFLKESESAEYGACEFKLNQRSIKFRRAKITPTKMGQFVTFWKRFQKGPIQPFDILDEFDILIVTVEAKNNFGQFIFSKSELRKRDIISQNGQGGRRAMRVYPPWDLTVSPQAKKTQKWQLDFFHDVPVNGPVDLSRAKQLLNL
jgi:hypothetical protein